MDPFTTNHAVGAHSLLASLRLVNRRTQEHVGPCPFCGGSGRRSDRFHVWMQPGHERFWCRACDAKGPLAKLLGHERPHQRPRVAPRCEQGAARPEPHAEHHAAYRKLYETVALWAHALLLDDCNPEPLAYLHGRGLSDATIARNILGVTLRDPTALVALLRREQPDLLPHAEEAGLLLRDHTGTLRAHPNLCGVLVFPYMAEGQIVDLRTRSIAVKGYRSLPGGYTERGALFPFGWDELGHTDTVILTEGEIKALAVSQAYHDGHLDAPALAHPGLTYLRDEWPAMLREKGVRTVVLAYDSQQRSLKDGSFALTPEETWTLRHGQSLADAGLEVRVLRLPLAGDETKSDLDAFLLAHPARRLQHLLDLAPSLSAYHHSLPRSLVADAKLTLPSAYPLRRSRPQRLDETVQTQAAPPTTVQPISLVEARSEIATLVRDHTLNGEGVVVLAHPPGTGKGHNTMEGLRAYLQEHPTPGQIVWTGLRKEQINDQGGIPLTPLHGRNESNCRKLGEAHALASKGYSVRAALCQRRCPFVGSCRYLAQFGQEADFFSSQDLLQATGWWEQAGVLVLDEFDPARLVRTVTLDSAHLAKMNTTATPTQARNLLRWLGTLLGSDTDRTISGNLLLAELETLARAEGINFTDTLRAACAALPDEDEVHRLAGLPHGAELADYAALPPNYLARTLTLLEAEQFMRRAALPYTSRLEVSGGRLLLYLRLDHLIDQLARPEQPKLILDATANEGLLRAIFPNTPLRMERPAIAGGAKVIQVISRDWAKSTLHDERLVRWYDEVAAQIRAGRPTLVVCTQACEAGLRAALHERGHTDVVVAHYGALRGSNAYIGYDVVLAQVYHPNLDAVIREGRALFAGRGEPLDERMTTTEKVLQDATEARWVVEVPTFSDERLAALLAHHREAELVQAALRGRPFDYPDAQITLLFGLPLDSLPPTEIREGTVSPESNEGREKQARELLVAAVQRLLEAGKQVISVADLEAATKQSPTTIHKHLPYAARQLHLRVLKQRRVVALPTGGERAYPRTVLRQRGRWVPLPNERNEAVPSSGSGQGGGTDHARTTATITRLIRHLRPAQRRRKSAHPRPQRRCYRPRGKPPHLHLGRDAPDAA